MNFYITILGSSAAAPTLGRHCSAQVVNMNGYRMLLDCGESTQNQLRAYHQRMQAFSTIFISHLHGDHIFGLPGLLSSMHLNGRTEPVTIYSPKGLKEAIQRLFDVSGNALQYQLNFVELDFADSFDATDPNSVSPIKEIFRNDKCIVSAFPLYHSVPCYGFLFEENIPTLNLRKEVKEKYHLTPPEIVDIKDGSDYETNEGIVVPNSQLTHPKRKTLKYAYCCDTAYTESIIPCIEGANLLCMESTFDHTLSDLAESRRHCTATHAAQMAQMAHVEKLLLTHFSARYNNTEVLVEEARRFFPTTIAASDGMILEVGN